MKLLPLHEVHTRLGAKMAPYAGFMMPLRYAGENTEYLAVRHQVGIFDISHMGEFFFEGPNALAFLNWITINDVSKLKIGKAQYSALLNEQGGIIDDVILYRLGEDRYLMVVNAANIEKDWAWIQSHKQDGVEIRNESDSLCLFAVSGPSSVALIKKVVGDQIDVEALPYYYCVPEGVTINGVSDILIATTGYTGERTFEIYVPRNHAEKVWNTLLEEGAEFHIQPAGLSIRDTLRLEMGYLLYGNDIHENITPLEAKMDPFIKWDKGDFIGKSALLKQKEEGIQYELWGVKALERGIPRKETRIYDPEGFQIGILTSGGYSPTLRTGIGLGYFKIGKVKNGSIVFAEIRGKPIKCEAVKRPPFLNTTSLLRWLKKEAYASD